MTCPRCKGRMHHDSDQGRLNQGDVVQTSTDCAKCINCGHRVYPEVEVVLPFNNKMKLPKPEYMKNAKPGRKPSHKELMEKYYTSIRKLRRGDNPASWDAIAKLIKTAENVPIVGRTVQQYFEEMSISKGSK